MAGTTSGKNENPGSVQSAGPNIGVQPGNVDSENAQVPGAQFRLGYSLQMFFRTIKLKTRNNQASTVKPASLPLK